MKYRIAAFMVVICALAWWVSLGNQDARASRTHAPHDLALGRAQLKADAGSLKGTIVTPHMEQQIRPGMNVLWCSTFQLAWNELYDQVGGPVTLSPASPMADILNKRMASKADLDAASYVAVAGSSDDVHGKIQSELRRKFKGNASPDLLESMPHGAIIAYSYLYKGLPFQWAFDRFHEKLKFGGKPVECFGIEQLSDKSEAETKMASQVSILDYRDRDDFVVELKALESDDRLILAKVRPMSTLMKTVRMVEGRMNAGTPSEMTHSSDLYVPVLDFDVLRRYRELEMRTITAGRPGLKGAHIASALQTIRFRLDETGAVLKSESILLRSIARTNMVFDKPFLIMLKRRNARNPYLALWVGNPELLVPARLK